MTDDISTLRQKARNARDNARAELVVVDAFMPEYRLGLSGATPPPTAETHARSMELYDFAIRSGHRARDFTRDAELLDRAADALESQERLRAALRQSTQCLRDVAAPVGPLHAFWDIIAANDAILAGAK